MLPSFIPSFSSRIILDSWYRKHVRDASVLDMWAAWISLAHLAR
jgi:hypothetical protein